MSVLSHFYGEWPELERIELGERVAYSYDEAHAIENRLCKSNGVESPLHHWTWAKDKKP